MGTAILELIMVLVNIAHNVTELTNEFLYVYL